jgi:hypothetical protein
MEDTPAVEILTRGLHTVLATMSNQNPNRIILEETLRYTAQSQQKNLVPTERTALIRLAAAHMRHADTLSDSAIENAALAIAKRAMTAALFECCSEPTQRRN